MTAAGTAAVPVPVAPVDPRPDLPTRVVRDSDKSTLKEVWEDSLGRLHREDGPAVILYDEETDRVVYREWHVRGMRHRLGAPAWEIYDRDGETVTEEYYYLDGKLSRIDGPSRVAYEDEKIVVRSWEFRGYSYDSQFAIAKKLLELPDNEIAFELRRTSYADLLLEGVPARRLAEVLAEGVSTFEGIRAVHNGAPVEWARSFEEGRNS